MSRTSNCDGHPSESLSAAPGPHEFLLPRDGRAACLPGTAPPCWGFPPRIIGRKLRLFQVPAELWLRTTFTSSAHHPGAPPCGPPHYRRGTTLPDKSQVGSGYHGSPSHGSERLPREGGLHLIAHLLHMLLLPKADPTVALTIRSWPRDASFFPPPDSP